MTLFNLPFCSCMNNIPCCRFGPPSLPPDDQVLDRGMKMMNALKQNFGVPQTNITIYHPADITWHSNLFRAWSDPFAPVPFGILIIQLSLSFKISFVLNSFSTTKSSFIAMWMMSICLGRQMDTQLKRHQDRKQFWVKCISRKNFWFLLVFVGVFFIGSLWGAFWSISANPWEGGGRSSGGIRQ